MTNEQCRVRLLELIKIAEKSDPTLLVGGLCFLVDEMIDIEKISEKEGERLQKFVNNHPPKRFKYVFQYWFTRGDFKSRKKYLRSLKF